VTGASEEALLLTPLRDALFGGALELHERRVTVDILAPRFPSAGTGTLRVVRALDAGVEVSIVAAYEDYVKL
jgi:hypothetical protein